MQDDQTERDLEISRMGGIFQNAYLVVIAASPPSPYLGYLANNLYARGEDDRQGHVWRESLVRYGNLSIETVRFRKAVHSRASGKDACALLKIGKRAWTYQERVLASRCLILQAREVIWECRASCFCECGGPALKPPKYETQLLPLQNRRVDGTKTPPICVRLFADAREAYQFWRDAVKSYSRRDLSFAQDRLPAISTLALKIQEAVKDEYLAGLWKGDLVVQLMWRAYPSGSPVTPYETYIAPSWSWASIPIPTYYNAYPKSFRLLPCANVLDAVCVPSGLNELGAVQDGSLLLRGPHCEAKMLICPPNTAYQDQSPHIELTFDNGIVQRIETNYFESAQLDGFRVRSVDMELTSGRSTVTLQRYHVTTKNEQRTCFGKVRLLWLVEDEALILAYSQRVQGAFERIGLLDIDMSLAVHNLTTTDIKLV